MNKRGNDMGTHKDIPFSDWVNEHQTAVESILDSILPADDINPHCLHTAMRYSAMDGGKRIRALLVFAAGHLADGQAAALRHSAAAVELIHAYSLVHDDMPCMDDDDLRRGKPSCHKQYDEATALLVGDSLQTLAFDLLSQPNLHSNTTQQIAMVNLLALASGSRGMAGGQAIDLASVGLNINMQQLQTMHALKTGALIRAAVSLGILSAPSFDRAMFDAMRVYAEHIGLAFQVVDDILDVEADTATLGKTAGKDAEASKPTYVSLLGLPAAKTLAQQLYASAIAAIAPYGDKALRLQQLAQWITQRNF